MFTILWLLNMSGLVKMLSGRKRDSSVWQHFEFMPQLGKSMCKILDSKGVKCGTLITGKNPTNLKVHMSSHHTATYRELEEAEEEKKKNLKKISED